MYWCLMQLLVAHLGASGGCADPDDPGCCAGVFDCPWGTLVVVVGVEEEVGAEEEVGVVRVEVVVEVVGVGSLVVLPCCRPALQAFPHLTNHCACCLEGI